MSPASRIAIAVVVVAVIGGAFFWGLRQHAAPTDALPRAVVVATPDVPPPAPPPPEPAAPAIQHPVPPAGGSGPLPSLDASDDYFSKALGDLLGHKSLLSFLVLDGFARRLVATVNNLATDSAASQMWPVTRTAGRFDVDARGGDSVISERNAARYAPFVRFVGGIDTQRAVALYVRVYPLLQRAYEDLGFPGQYFNDRVITVIDHLLATPDVAGPIKIKRVVAPGVVPAPGAPGLYVYEDPSLEARSSGQKILLRMGSDNARLLKAKLTDLRQRLAKGAAVRLPPHP